jgi:sigma-B regulation protein RsbU (phosphoserine phosphatase)
LLEAINEVFFQELRRHRKFMTLLVGELDPVENLLKLQNAGQNYPIVLNGKTGQAELPDMPGFPMGVRKKVDTSARDFSIAPGDAIVFYTDGIPECEVAKEVFFGMQPFIEVTGRLNQRGATASDILDGFLAEFDRCRLPGPLLDDVTMIVLRRNN